MRAQCAGMAGIKEDQFLARQIMQDAEDVVARYGDREAFAGTAIADWQPLREDLNVFACHRRGIAGRSDGIRQAAAAKANIKSVKLKHSGERKRRRTDENAMARRSNCLMCGLLIDRDAAILTEEP